MKLFRGLSAVIVVGALSVSAAVQEEAGAISSEGDGQQVAVTVSVDQFLEMVKGGEQLPDGVQTEVATLENGEPIVVPKGVDANQLVAQLQLETSDRGSFAISTWTVGANDKRVVATSGADAAAPEGTVVKPHGYALPTTCSALGYLWVDLAPSPDKIVSSAAQSCAGPLLAQNVYTYLWRWGSSSFQLTASRQSGITANAFASVTYKRNCSSTAPWLYRGGVQGYAQTPTASGSSSLETEDKSLGCQY